MKAVKKCPTNEYPKLMLATKSGSVYLMTGLSCGSYTGTKLTLGDIRDNGFPIGTYLTTWTSNGMVDFEGKVELTN